MAQNYTRQSTLSDGDTITASLFNDEYNQLVNAFTYSSTSASSTGHRHDGSAGQGGNIFKIGDLDFLNKIEVDSTNNRWGFYVEVSSAAVEQIRIQDGAIVPVTTNDIDLGTSSLQFKDLYIDGTANVDSLTLTSGSTVTTILDEDDLSSDSATALVTQQSVKAYIDAQVTAQDLDFQADTGGALSIDLDSETMTFTGGTGIDTSGSGNAVTFAIDSTVTTLTGTQTLTNKTLTTPVISTISNTGTLTLPTSTDTLVGRATTDTLTNKTLTSPDVNTPDIDGGTIDGATIATSDITVGTGKTLDVSSGTLTLANDQISGDKVEGGTIASTTITSLASTTVDTTNLEVTNIKAKDGTSAGSIADSTGVVTLASSVLTTTDINGGTIDNTVIGGTTTAAGSFTSVNATSLDVAGTVEFDGLSGTGAVSVTDILDQDDMSSNSATALATQQSIKAYVDSQVGANNELSEVLANGNTTGGTDIAVSTGDHITFADSSMAKFGAGNDLQIYHNGSHSFISEAGTGDLYIGASNNIAFMNAAFSENKLLATTDGALTLYYDGSAKLATTSSGVDITGTAVTDGLTVDGATTINRAILSSTASDPALEISARTDSSNLDFKFTDTDGSVVVDQVHHKSEYYASDGTQVSAKVRTEYADVSGGMNYVISTSGAGVAVRDRIKVASTGDITFFDNDGTTTSLFYDANAGLTINEAGADRDFRVESDSNTHALFVNAGNNRVAISTASPQALFHVEGDQYVVTDSGVAVNGIHVASATAAADNTYGGAISFDTGSLGSSGIAAVNDGPSDTDSNGLAFFTHGSGTGGADAVERMRISYDGSLGLGTDSPASLLHLSKATGGTGSDPIEINIDSTHNGNWTADSDWGHINFRVPNESSTPDGDTHIQIAANAGSSTSGAVNDAVLRVKNVSGTLSERMRWDYDGTISFSDKDGSETARINNDGNFLLGTTTVAYAGTLLNIGTTSDTQNGVQIQTSTTGNGYILFGDGSGADAYRGQIQYEHTNDKLTLRSGGAIRQNLSSTEAVFNEGSTDTDFRVESDDNSHMLFVDAGNDSVNIGDSDGSLATLQVRGEVGGSIFRLFSGTSYQGLQFNGETTFGNGTVQILPVTIPGSGTANQYTYFNSVTSGGTTKHHVVVENSFQVQDGGAVFNQDGNDNDFRVESDNNSNMIFVDASIDSVGIGTGSPSSTYMLDVGGAMRSSGSAPGLTLTETDASNQQWIVGSYGGTLALRDVTGGTYPFQITTGAPTNSILIQSGGVTVNDNSADLDFRIESDNISNMLFVDAGNDTMLVANNITMSANEIDVASGDLTVDVAGDIILDADGADIIFADGGTQYGFIANSSSDMVIKPMVQDRDLIFKGNDGGSTITALTLDMSEAGSATFNNDVLIPQYIKHVGDVHTRFGFQGGDEFEVSTAGSNRLKIVGSGTVFNEDSNNVDLRVESDNNTHALFVDAGNDTVNINRSSGPAALNVQSDSGADGIAVYGRSSDEISQITMYNSSGTGLSQLQTRPQYFDIRSLADVPVIISPNSSGKFYVYSGETVVNENGADHDFRVESASTANQFFLDASTGNIGINTGSPDAHLDVRGAVAFEKTASRNISGGAVANNYHVIYDLDFSASAFSTNQHFIRLIAAGSTSGQMGSADLIVTFKQQGTSKFFNIVPIQNDGLTLGYVWDASGGGTSNGNLKIYAAGPASYSYLQVYATNRDANPDDNILAGTFPMTDTGSGTAPAGMVTIESPLDYSGNKYNQNGRVDNTFVINEESHDLNFRVESDSNSNAFFLDAGSGNIGMGGTSNVPLNIFRNGAGNTELLRLTNNNTNNHNFYVFVNDDDNYVRFGSTGDNGGNFAILDSTNTNDTIRLFTGGGAVFNEQGGSAATSQDFRVESNNNSHMLFVDSSNDCVAIGDGSASSAQTLLVSKVGNQTEATAQLRIQGNGYSAFHWLDATAYYIGQNSSLRSLRIYSGAETAGAQLSANATSFTTFSDERLKYDVEPIENALDSLSGLRTVKYRLEGVDSPSDKKKLGVIAQDLVGVHDEVLDPMMRSNDDTEYMGVRYTELVPVLIKAVQEQTEIINDLRARVAQLESN